MHLTLRIRSQTAQTGSKRGFSALCIGSSGFLNCTGCMICRSCLCIVQYCFLGKTYSSLLLLVMLNQVLNCLLLINLPVKTTKECFTDRKLWFLIEILQVYG